MTARTVAPEASPGPLGGVDGWPGSLRLDIVWPVTEALLFGDAMLRRHAGELRRCPDSWLAPEGGHARLRTVLAGLSELPVEHVLVSHGPLVLGRGRASLRAALG